MHTNTSRISIEGTLLLACVSPHMNLPDIQRRERLKASTICASVRFVTWKEKIVRKLDVFYIYDMPHTWDAFHLKKKYPHDPQGCLFCLIAFLPVFSGAFDTMISNNSSVFFLQNQKQIDTEEGELRTMHLILSAFSWDFCIFPISKFYPIWAA